MLGYAVTIIWLLGCWSWGWWVATWLGLRSVRRVVLAYPLGLASVGIATLSFWQPGIPFSWLYFGWWLVFLVSSLAWWGQRPGSVMVQAQKVRAQIQTIAWSALHPLQSVWLWLGLASGVLVTAWWFLVQPVVWDALVLYDWRAARIADGWSLTAFFQQFTQQSDFYNYDFSHPFLSSIWQAFLWRSGLPVTGLIYWGVFISLISYAGIIWRRWTPWLIFMALWLTTAPLFTVLTQVYAALPYALFWGLIFLVIIDPEVRSVKHKTSCLLLLLVALMLNRMSEPFWFIFVLWWATYVLRQASSTRHNFLAMMLFVLVPLAVFWQWQELQQTALQFVSLEEGVSRSSYALARYAAPATILHHAEWFTQTLQLITLRNPAFPYLVLAWGLAFMSRPWSKQERWWLGLAVLWIGLLAVAVLFEVSGDPAGWAEKSRLLWRVTIPLMVWATVFTGQLVKKHWTSH